MNEPRMAGVYWLGLIFSLGFWGEIGVAQSPLRPWSENPWYWSVDDRPVLLLGGSDDDNLFQWPAAELIPQLDRLKAAGGNVVRNTMSDRKDRGFEVYPFREIQPGRYDLEQWNDEYWARFETFLKETARRNIFVQIEIWDRFDYVDQNSNRWQIHPYNPKNNVNYTYADSGFAETYPDHPGLNRQPFFFTTPNQRHQANVLRYQQRFVDKMLDHSLQYGHVLYCIDNETNGEEAWSRYWAEWVKLRAEKAGKDVFITEMWDDWDLRADRHKRTYDHPDRYGYVDVSQNNHNRGEQHWERFLGVRDYLRSQPRPMNSTKIYGADKNKFGHTDQDGIERFWRYLLAGAASMRFHRPDSGLGLSDRAVACLRAARLLEAEIPLWQVEADLTPLADRDSNEAFLAQQAGLAYAVYFPAGGQVRLDLREQPGPFILQWISIGEGRKATRSTVSGGQWLTLTPPDQGNWAAAVTRAPDPQPAADPGT
jgi:hypothetical protein